MTEEQEIEGLDNLLAWLDDESNINILAYQEEKHFQNLEDLLQA